MTVAAIAIGIVLAVLVGGWADRAGRAAARRLLTWWRARGAPVPGYRTVGWDEECPLCDGGRGAYVPEAEAHVFSASYEEAWAGAGAASGTSVVYCAEHCPGGCSRGCHAAT